MSPAASCLTASLFVKGTPVSRRHLGQTVSLLILWRVLDVAHLDEGQQPFEMPFLAFEGDSECDHPVIDQLGRDDLAVRLLLLLTERCRRHLVVDVLVDGVKMFRAHVYQ